jgi:gamma-glutamyltranspeptidase/glutathione hydrolase
LGLLSTSQRACAAVVLLGCAAWVSAQTTGASTQPASSSAKQAASAPLLPEGASGIQRKAGVNASRHMVAAANPLAAEAGLRMLRAGGSAVDAMVAVQMMLTLVEPQSSGIGGGAFLMHWDGQRVTALDGRETAPAAADERLFLQADGKPIPFAQAVVGGRVVGVPGTVRLMEVAHQRHGRLPWAALFEPAIQRAEQGFAVSARMHTLLKAETALRRDAHSAAYFYGADGEPHPVGHVLRNPALAAVLRAIAQRGSEAFHQGPVAEDLVRRVREHPTNPGRMTLQDVAGYRVVEREPMCTPWRTWQVCGFPPPSSGHLTIMQILGMGEHLGWGASPLNPAGLPGVDFLHRYAEASRLAFADRALYVADPAFVQPPGGDWSRMLDAGYLRERATLIGPRRAEKVEAGTPPGTSVRAQAPQPEQPEYGTSHVSIVDAQGHAVALTTTIEAGWGARILADGGTGLPGGYLLNNELTDFSFAPADAQGRPVANRVQAGKRPRSSMSPTLVFEVAGAMAPGAGTAPGAAGVKSLRMVLGSPGGAAIIHFTARTMLGALAFGLDAQRAIDGPNFGTFGGPLLLEKGRFDAATAAALKALGHEVREIDMTSGLQAIERQPGGWSGAADPRREGVALGD